MNDWFERRKGKHIHLLVRGVWYTGKVRQVREDYVTLGKVCFAYKFIQIFSDDPIPPVGL